jgi:hypothetical protein
MTNEESFQNGSAGYVATCSHRRSCRLRRGLHCAPPRVVVLSRTFLAYPAPNSPIKKPPSECPTITGHWTQQNRRLEAAIPGLR